MNDTKGTTAEERARGSLEERARAYQHHIVTAWDRSTGDLPDFWQVYAKGATDERERIRAEVEKSRDTQRRLADWDGPQIDPEERREHRYAIEVLDGLLKKLEAAGE